MDTTSVLQQLKEKNNLLNAITDHIVYQDGNHCIIWANTAASNSLSMKPNDLIGRNCHELWHGKDKACRGCPITKVFRTGKPQKSKITSPDGRIWRVSGYPVRDEKGRIAGAVEITSDITDRIKTEEALLKSEERFREVFENTAIGLYRTTPEGRILMANPTLIRMLGFSSFEDLTKRNLEENGYSPKYPRLGFKRRIEKMGQIIGLESAWEKKDGTRLYINENARAIRDKKGKIVYYEGTIEDITARKLAELQIKESEMLYRELVEKAGIGVLVDDESGKIIYANERAAELYGYTPEEIKQQSIESLVHPEDIEMVLKHHKDRLVGRDVPSSYQFRGIKKDGTIRRVELDVVLVEKDDQFLGTRLYLKDVTDRYENEKKIRAALKEKELLLREIHHRVKNNMQIISSLLNLQSHSIKDEDALQIFKICQNRIRSMALIHETLYSSDNLAGIDFSDYVKRITSYLLRLYKDDVSEITVISDVKDVFLDINRAIPCGLILNELISNSLKHAFPGKRKGKIKIHMHFDLKGKYTLIVSDTGIGFPEELDIHKTKTLGMKLVSDLVHQLDGTLSLIREKGTRFRIEF